MHGKTDRVDTQIESVVLRTSDATARLLVGVYSLIFPLTEVHLQSRQRVSICSP